MKYRNAKRNSDGSFDCEIEHPVHGWIPFTARRGDAGAAFDVEALAEELDRDPETAPYVEPPPEPVSVPQSITFAQLLIGLVTEGWITEAEGGAWLEGRLPGPVQTLISTLPGNQRFAAKARAIRPSAVLRNDPLVGLLAAAQGKTTEELDAFFITYGAS